MSFKEMYHEVRDQLTETYEPARPFDPVLMGVETLKSLAELEDYDDFIGVNDAFETFVQNFKNGFTNSKIAQKRLELGDFDTPVAAVTALAAEAVRDGLTHASDVGGQAIAWGYTLGRLDVVSSVAAALASIDELTGGIKNRELYEAIKMHAPAFLDKFGNALTQEPDEA